MLLTVSSAYASEVGHVREHNEDCLWVDDAMGVWLVADGMGGHAAGEVASKMALEVMTKQLRDGRPMDVAIQTAHQTIKAAGEVDQAHHGMGTTVVAVQQILGGFELSWVGDSRGYQWDTKQGLSPLSYDHSFVQDMVFRGVLTAEEATVHPKKNLINQALGMNTLDTLKVSRQKIYPKCPGRLLLCSDGVSDMLTDPQLNELLSKPGDVNTVCSAITAAVLATEASDNFSFIIIEYQPSTLIGWANRIRHQRLPSN